MINSTIRNEMAAVRIPKKFALIPKGNSNSDKIKIKVVNPPKIIAVKAAIGEGFLSINIASTGIKSPETIKA